MAVSGCAAKSLNMIRHILTYLWFAEMLNADIFILTSGVHAQTVPESIITSLTTVIKDITKTNLQVNMNNDMRRSMTVL